jgi:hypothetical protein
VPPMLLRCGSLAAAGALAAVGLADRLVTVPTGVKLRDRTAKFELRTERSGNPVARFDAAVGHSWELGIRTAKTDFTGSLSYNYLLPLVDLTPGIALGLDDLSNVTEEGRGAYLAFTFFLGNTGEFNQDIPTEFTFGFWARRKGGLFLGASVPIAQPFRIVAEHDSRRLWAGFDIRPVKDASLKVMFSETSPSISFSYQTRF